MNASDPKRRFFYHYRKMDGRMSVHFKGQCFPCQHVKCLVPCETKRNTQQPYLVLQGYATRVIIEKDTAWIQ